MFFSRAVLCMAMNIFSLEKYLEFVGELNDRSVQAVVGLEELFNDGGG